MMMMATPAAFAKTSEKTRIRPPIALALAPSATKIVVKPSTNKAAPITVSRRTAGSGSASPKRSSDRPER